MNDDDDDFDDMPTSDPPTEFNEAIQGMRKIAINNLFRIVQSGEALEGLATGFQKAYSIGFQNSSYAVHLFYTYKEIINDFIKNVTEKSFENKIGKDLLIEFLSQWEKIKIIIYWMKKLFMYLDTEYYSKIIFKINPENKKSLTTCGFNIFRRLIFEKFCEPVVKQVFKEIESEKEGKLVDWDLIQKIIRCYVSAGATKIKLEREGNELIWKGEENTHYYDNLFEPKYIEYSTNYYKEEASKWFSFQSTPEFTNTALAAFDHEKEKVEKFLNKSTFIKLQEQMVDVIIKQYDKKLVESQESGCQEMLKNNKLKQLKNLYLLFLLNKDSFKYIFEILKDYLKGKALIIIKNIELEKKPVKFIDEFINLKNEMNSIIIESFNKDPEFYKIINFTFLEIIRDYENFPSFLAIYSDSLLRVELKGKESAQAIYINNIIFFVSCIVQKDSLIHHYRFLLGNRLLNSTSFDRSLEQDMISKLSEECGYNSVDPLRKMIEDIDLSIKLQSNFELFHEKQNTNKIKLGVKVLNNKHWLFQGQYECNIPPLISNLIDNFQLFYNNLESGKPPTLLWLFSQGDCKIKTNFLPKSYRLTVTYFQYLILGQFNQKDVMTYSELLSLKIPKEHLDLNLKFLCIPSRALISKMFPGKATFSENEELKLNKNFVAKSLKIDLKPPYSEIKKCESITQKVEELILASRSYYIDSLIMLILKAMKGLPLNYNNLIAKAIPLCIRCKPEIELIKQEIESLIAKNYIRRDPENRSQLYYIA